MKKSDTIRIRVTGKVQGVFFRQSTLEKATELGIKGFVRNETDGSVYIEARGSKMEAFLEWLHQGPARAEVDQVKAGKIEDERSFEDFHIQR